MSQLLISLLTLFLLLASGFVVLIVLMQRTGQGGGMGGALGGGAAESAFGAETNDVFTKTTIYSIIVFFVIALVIYLMYQAKSDAKLQADESVLMVAPEALTEEVPVETKPAAVASDVEVSTADDLFIEESVTPAVETEVE